LIETGIRFRTARALKVRAVLILIASWLLDECDDSMEFTFQELKALLPNHATPLLTIIYKTTRFIRGVMSSNRVVSVGTEQCGFPANDREHLKGQKDATVKALIEFPRTSTQPA